MYAAPGKHLPSTALYLADQRQTTWGGGRADIVLAYEKGSMGAFLSSGYEKVKQGGAAVGSGLKRVGSSGSSLNLLGGDKPRKLSRPLSTSEKSPSW